MTYLTMVGQAITARPSGDIDMKPPKKFFTRKERAEFANRLKAEQEFKAIHNPVEVKKASSLYEQHIRLTRKAMGL